MFRPRVVSEYSFILFANTKPGYQKNLRFGIRLHERVGGPRDAKLDPILELLKLFALSQSSRSSFQHNDYDERASNNGRRFEKPCKRQESG